MTDFMPVAVYASARDGGMANAIAAGLSARTFYGSQAVEMRHLARHTAHRGRALIVLPRGGVGWSDAQLPALRAAIMVGDLSSSRSMISGLLAGAHAVINSRLPFESLLDDVQAAARVPIADIRCSPGHGALLRRLRVRAEEAARITSLTDREFEIVGFLHGGSTVHTIARTAHISRTTVRAHIRNILHKLGVHSQLEASAMLARSGHDSRTGQLERRIAGY